MRQSDDRGSEGPDGFVHGPRDFDPAPQREPIFNLPPAVAWTAGILIALHVGFVLLSAELQLSALLNFSFIPARFSGLPPEFLQYTNSDPAWGVLTMITHAGLHGGMTHLIFNVLWLMAFATPVVRMIGTVRYAALFILSAMAGAGTYWLVQPDLAVPVVGASGAVSGMMGAAIRYMFAPRFGGGMAGVGQNAPRLAPLSDRRLLGFVAIWLVINLIFGLIGFGVGGESIQIAWEAHVGGFLAGLLLVPLFDRQSSN